jgi:hypothetical protein
MCQRSFLMISSLVVIAGLRAARTGCRFWKSEKSELCIKLVSL